MTNNMDRLGADKKIAEHINANASKYFPQLEGTEIKIELIDEQHRAFSSLYRFKIANQQTHYNLFAKGIPLRNNSRQDDNTKELRPRLAPRATDYGERTRLEHSALTVIDKYFEKLNNPRFGAIRVFDFIQSPQTIIMEECRDPSLRRLLASRNHLRHLCGLTPPLLTVFSNAGAWLKEYSALPKTENIMARNHRRDHFVESITHFTNFLGQASGNTSFFQQVAKTIIPATGDIMPSSLPLGLGHGDYAMRNILVGANERITSFDTCARWKVPIYEDIAYFLVQLETNKLQVLTLGLAIHPRTLAAYKKAFLAGYFGKTHTPNQVIRLFQIQLLLDSWCSRLSMHSKPYSGIKKVYHKMYLTLLNRRYRIILDRLLNEIAAHSSS